MKEDQCPQGFGLLYFYNCIINFFTGIIAIAISLISLLQTLKNIYYGKRDYA